MKVIKSLILFLFFSSFANANIAGQDNLIQNYLALKNALAIDNGNSARNSAKLMYDNLTDFKVADLTPSQMKVWKQYVKKLSDDVQQIQNTSELEIQRGHFTSLSENMFKLLKGLKINSENLYYQFCPMANEAKGAYWLNEKVEIINPYMGKQMPRCGSNKDSLIVK